MTDSRMSINRTYDPVILEAAWGLRDKFVVQHEANPDETRGFYLTQWLSGDELSPGCYSIVEWENGTPIISSKESALGTWICKVSEFSDEQTIKDNPNQLISAIIDIYLAQARHTEFING